MKTLPIDEIVETLVELADAYRKAGRTGRAEVLVDASRIIKLYDYQKRQSRHDSMRRKCTTAL